MNQNTDDETTTFETGDRVTINYDSPQAENPVEKTGVVVKTWETGYEFVADADDDDRRIKVVHSDGFTDYKGRARVTSVLRDEDGNHGEGWRHGSELGYVVSEESEGDDEEAQVEETVLDDLEQGDEVEVRYTTSRGNEATVSGRVQHLSESAFTDQTSGAVLYDPDDDRRYRLHGTRRVTVASLRSGSPVQVGHSGTVYVESEDDEPELRADGGQDSEDDEEEDEFEEWDLDRENTHAKPVSATATNGRTYAVRVEEVHKDGSKHTDHYTEEQARKLLSDLQDVLDDEE